MIENSPFSLQGSEKDDDDGAITSGMRKKSFQGRCSVEEKMIVPMHNLDGKGQFG